MNRDQRRDGELCTPCGTCFMFYVLNVLTLNHVYSAGTLLTAHRSHGTGPEDTDMSRCPQGFLKEWNVSCCFQSIAARVSHTLHAKGIFGKGSQCFWWQWNHHICTYIMLCCTMQGEWERGEAGRSGGKGMKREKMFSWCHFFQKKAMFSKILQNSSYLLFEIWHSFQYQDRCQGFCIPQLFRGSSLETRTEPWKWGRRKTPFLVFWTKFPEFIVSSFCVFPSFQIICRICRNVGLQLGENKVPFRFRCCGDVFWKRVKW